MPVLLSKHGNGTSIMYTEDICRYLMISVDDFRCLPKDFGHFTASSASHLCRRVILDVSVIIWWVPSGWSLRISVAGTIPRGDFSWFPPFRSLHFPSQIFMFSIRTLRTCLCCHVRNLFIWFGRLCWQPSWRSALCTENHGIFGGKFLYFCWMFGDFGGPQWWKFQDILGQS